MENLTKPPWCVAKAVLSLACFGMLAACSSPQSPAIVVSPNLANQPDDRDRINEQLDASKARPDAEQRAQISRSASQAEHTAASVAAILGSLLSTSDYTVVGGGIGIDLGAPPPTSSPQQPAPQPNLPTGADEEIPAAKVRPGACLLLFGARSEACKEQDRKQLESLDEQPDSDPPPSPAPSP